MPPRTPPTHASKPSLGLMDDLNQLSPLAAGKLSPGHTNIQLEEEVDGSELPHGEADLESGAPPRVALNLDPSRSGEFPTADEVPSKRSLAGCWRRVLEFPSLSVVFPITLVISFLLSLICLLIAPNAFKYLTDDTASKVIPSPGMFAFSLIITFFLTCLLLLATRQLLYQLFDGEIKPLQIIGLYLGTVLLYGDIYFTGMCFDVRFFTFATTPSTEIVSMWVACQYFSVTTITSTGIGDLAPKFGFGKLIASSELLLSLLYHIGIFSLGLEHFQKEAEAVDGDGKTPSRVSNLIDTAREKMRDLRSRYPRLDAIRRFFIASVFPISLLIQLAFLIVLHLYDPHMFDSASGNSADSFIISMFFIAQLVQFVLILLMTLALVRQIHTSYVSPGFLLQSWLATVSLFAGLYVLIYLLVPDSGAFVLFPASQTAPYAVADVVGNFFWFSMCCMTTTGFGDVYPLHIVARIVVSFQMIISVCYTVVILGQALASTLGFINRIRVQRGAPQLGGLGGKNTAVTNVPETIPEDAEGEVESITLDHQAEDDQSQSEFSVDEEEVPQRKPPPRAAPTIAPAAAKKAAKARASATLPPRWQEQEEHEMAQPIDDRAAKVATVKRAQAQAMAASDAVDQAQSSQVRAKPVERASSAKRPAKQAKPLPVSKPHSRVPSRGMFDPDPEEVLEEDF